MLHGVGRSCFEGMNPAIYADYFAADSSAAFGNIVLFVGVSSASTFFAFPFFPKESIADADGDDVTALTPGGKRGMAAVGIACAALTIPCCLLAVRVHRRRGQTLPVPAPPSDTGRERTSTAGGTTDRTDQQC